MYKIITTNRFEKDVLRCKKRGLNLSDLQTAMKIMSIRFRALKLVKLSYTGGKQPFE